jgi:hypothetical protein
VPAVAVELLLSTTADLVENLQRQPEQVEHVRDDDRAQTL